MRILFISRSFPPVVGGIENHNFELWQSLSHLAVVRLIANKKGKKFLPFFLPYTLLSALILMRKYDVLLLGDGVLGLIGWVVKFFYKKPVICVVHGLDLTYPLKLYQYLWVKHFIKKADKLIAVGRETIKIGVEKSIDKEKFVFIPNGIDIKKFERKYSRADLEKIIGEKLDDKKVILTSGRLVKRKGVAWFLENVMPQLDNNIIYVICGDGPDKINIKETIQKNNLENRVKLLGYVPNKTRNILLQTCDLFIQPNIKVPNDIEGFGISVLEAAVCSLPVIASRLEGLKDSVQDGISGFLVEPGNVQDFVKKINQMLIDEKYRLEFGKSARDFVVNNYNWEQIARQYLSEIEKTLNGSNNNEM